MGVSRTGLFAHRLNELFLFENYRAAQVGRDLERSSGPSLGEKGSSVRLWSILCNCTLHTAHSNTGDPATTLGRLFQ